MNTEDRFDEEIENIVDQLTRIYKPEKIILFGSLVDGKIREGTDIDLFIIKKDIVPKSIDKYARNNARLRLSGHGTNSGYSETFGMQKLDRSIHRQDVIPVGRSVVWH